MKRIIVFISILVLGLIGEAKASIPFPFDFTGDYIDATSVNDPPVFDIHHVSDTTNLFSSVVNADLRNHYGYFQFRLNHKTSIDGFTYTLNILPGLSRIPESQSGQFYIYSEALGGVYPGPNIPLVTAGWLHIDDEFEKEQGYTGFVDVNYDFDPGLYWLAVDIGGGARTIMSDLYSSDGGSLSVVPEPPTYLLFFLGLGIFLVYSLKKRTIKII